MKRFSALIKTLTCTTLALGISLMVLGCNSDSAESIVRNIEIIVQGFYGPTSGNTTIVSGNTGGEVTLLNVRQNGANLEAVDNNNIIFSGTVGQATEDTASFTLRGNTTIGTEVTISGTINVPVGSSSATMAATWIEPTLFANLSAEATVPVNDPDTGDGDDGGDTNDVSNLTVTANPSTIDTTSTDLTSSISVRGSDGDLSATLSSSTLGEITSTSGDGAVYRANPVTGTQNITVTDGTGASDSVTITQN
jgi:hypothetical protein